jgi:hypothetical protein
LKQAARRKNAASAPPEKRLYCATVSIAVIPMV